MFIYSWKDEITGTTSATEMTDLLSTGFKSFKGTSSRAASHSAKLDIDLNQLGLIFWSYFLSCVDQRKPAWQFTITIINMHHRVCIHSNSYRVVVMPWILLNTIESDRTTRTKRSVPGFESGSISRVNVCGVETWVGCLFGYQHKIKIDFNPAAEREGKEPFLSVKRLAQPSLVMQSTLQRNLWGPPLFAEILS